MVNINSHFNTPITSLNYSDGKNSYFVKRDDLIPFSFGGNKVRIAYQYFKDMEDKGKNCIISYGSSQSNLNRVIANISKSKNIPCYIIVPVEKDSNINNNFNTILIQLYGAKIINCDKKEVAQTVDFVMKKVKKDGLKPYYIFGNKFGQGNEIAPVNAYFEAYKEIKNFEVQNEIRFDYIFLASGTGMTQAGLLCGKAQYKDNKNIIGISIARNKKLGRMTILNYVKKYYEYYKEEEIAEMINFDDKYINGGYGKYNQQIFEKVRELLVYDGIPLDPTYTGKAFWGMQEYINENQIKEKNILFLHTGGMPIFFDNLYKIGSS